VTVALLLALVLQDPPQDRTLAWKLAEGQKYTVAWRNAGKMRFIAGATRMDVDLKVEMTGKMSVSSIAKTGQAETLISIRRHEIKGTANGNPLQGHEQDFILLEGDCDDVPDPTPTPEGSVDDDDECEDEVEVTTEGEEEQETESACPTPAGTGTPGGGELGGTGTPSDTALSVWSGSSPLPTILFSILLVGSLGGLAYANVAAIRRRS